MKAKVENLIKILVTDHFTSESLTKLSVELPCKVVHSKTKFPTAEEIKDARVLLTRSRTEVNSKLLRHAEKLELVVTSTSGFDHIDLELCRERNIKALYTPDANPPCAAEITMLLLLNVAHQIKGATKTIESVQWRDVLKKTSELGGKNLGIIGLGRVGSRVAKMAQAFGMDVSAYDPYIEDAIFTDLKVERLGLTELFIQCPYITLHVPLTIETHRLINRATLETMSPGVTIINASRGAVIDENELAEALERGQVAAAALDVFENEPLPQSSKLRMMDAVFTTPHIGGFSQEAFDRASEQAINKVIAYFQLGQITDSLPPNAAWAQAQYR